MSDESETESAVKADEKLKPPENHAPLPPFHALVTGLFRPLSDEKQLKMLSIATRKGPSEVRDELIRQFIRNWRKRVGNDIYPVFRLVMPQLDKERAMYGLKESALGKVLVKVLNINVTSPDAEALSKWKSGSVYSAGNFAQRCYEILIKRDTKTTFGNLTIGDVNDLLDKLSTDKEQHIPVITQLVHNTNAEEMSWIVRIILRSVRMGASEKRFFNLWHPDAESLYSVTSDLKRVSWQLWDPTYRLPSNENQISLRYLCWR
jgi:DNA ligase-4